MALLAVLFFALIVLLVIYPFRSQILGLLDYLAILGFILTKVRYLHLGFGDLEALEQLANLYRDENINGVDIDGLKIVSIGQYIHESSHTRVNITFESPVAKYLPECSKKGHMQIVLPAHSKTMADAKSIPAVILAPATGEEGYGYRRKAHAIPLAKRGVVSVIPMFPFYAARRPDYQRKHYIATASDMGRSVPAGGIEMAAIASWLCGANDRKPREANQNKIVDNDVHHVPGDENRTIIFAGRSLGCCTAGMASLKYKRRHGLVSAAPPLSAAAGYVDGILYRTIPWGQYTSQDQEKIKTLLKSFSLMEVQSPTDIERDVRCIIAKHDKFVLLDSVRQYLKVMKNSGSNVRVTETHVPGGHGIALFMHSLFVEKICDSIVSFKKCQ